MRIHHSAGRLNNAIGAAVILFLFSSQVSPCQDKDSPLVGVWYTAFYYKNPHVNPRRDSTVMWYATSRDTLKTPVVGWGKDTLVGDYSSQDTGVVRRQIAAMKRAGIDFIIVDMTNGLYPVEPPFPKYVGDGLTTNALRVLFKVMSSIPLKERLPISVALGMEFWGRHSFCYYWGYWDGWEKQYQRQEHALDQLREYFDSPNYLTYEGKPLLLTMLESGLDYPPVDDGGSPIPEWNYPFVTIKRTVNWPSTYSALRYIGDGTCVDTSTQTMIGADVAGFWGWGAGAQDSLNGWDQRPLPAHDEQMAIMPGTQMWLFDGDPVRIKRRRGNQEYYIRSWKQVIRKKPRIVTICDWNNWNEETAIEGCIGKRGWTDLNGKPTYDWYLKITSAYAAVFKGVLPAGTFVRQDGFKKVYRWNGTCLKEYPLNYKPAGHPIIQLPPAWLQRHKYWRHCDHN